jgi:hypothetical protein
MTSSGSGNDLQQRIKQLCDEYTMSEVARRTGTPVSSVHRYVTGARVPAEFCAAIVRSIGVNPAWLLVGEGSRMLSEVPMRAAAVADDMLEVVEAMNAVERMRLGSLVGSKHGKTLVDLNDALMRHSSLRERLEKSVVPIAKELLDLLFQATDKRELSRAQELHKGVSQIIRFTEDPTIRLQYYRNSAHLEYVSGNDQAAADLQRQAFMLTFSDPNTSVDLILTEGQHLSSVLAGMGRFIESVAIARSTLAICDAREPRTQKGFLLAGTLGQRLLDIGEGAEGTALVMEALANMPESAHKRSGESVTLSLRYLMEGEAPSRLVPWYSSHPSSRTPHILAALLTDEEDELRCVLETGNFPGVELNVAENFLITQARFVYNYCRKRGSRKVEEPSAEGLPLSPTDQVSLDAYTATRERYKGRTDQAAQHVQDGFRKMNALGSHSTVPVMPRCILFREALLSTPDSPEGKAAKSGLDELTAVGYGCTRWVWRALAKATT